MRSREFAAIPLVVALLGFVGLLVLAVYTGPWAWILLVVFTLVAAGFLFWWYSKRHPHPSADDAPVVARVDDEIFRVLVVADESCSADALRDELAARSAGRPTRALVIAPSLSSRLDRLTGDEQAYQVAQDHLSATLDALESHRRRGRRAHRPARPDPGRRRRAARVPGRPDRLRDPAGGQRQPAGEGSRRGRGQPLRHPRREDRLRSGGQGLSGWLDAELALTALAAMLSPTTLSFSVLALVVGDRPFRTGSLFYLGALTATLAVGVAAAFVLGDSAASHSSTPKTWVAVFDVVAGVLLLVWVVRRPATAAERGQDEEHDRPDDQGRGVARRSRSSGPAPCSRTPAPSSRSRSRRSPRRNPSATEYVVEWVFFSVVSLLPLLLALVMLVVARDRTTTLLQRVRDWLLAHVRTVAAVIVVLLALALIRDGISGLVG